MDAGHLELFFGSKRSAFTLDALCLETLKPELLKGERALYGSKWFDYRMMHPGKATHYFLACVNRAHAQYIERTQDYRKAEYASCVKATDLFALNSGQLNALWKARQVADGFGAPYEIFLRGVYKVVESEGWQHAPFANQLATDRLLVGGQLAWEEERAAYVRMPVHEFYRAGSEYQWKKAFDVWWVQQIWARSARQHLIKAAISKGWQTRESITSAARIYFGSESQ